MEAVGDGLKEGKIEGKKEGKRRKQGERGERGGKGRKGAVKKGERRKRSVYILVAARRNGM